MKAETLVCVCVCVYNSSAKNSTLHIVGAQ